MSNVPAEPEKGLTSSRRGVMRAAQGAHVGSCVRFQLQGGMVTRGLPLHAPLRAHCGHSPGHGLSANPGFAEDALDLIICQFEARAPEASL
jgi:hypothetical protein